MKSQSLMMASYCLYFVIVIFQILWPAKKIHSAGRVYLVKYLGENRLVDPVNDVLLTGYYTISIGYSMWKVIAWPQITNISMMIQVVAFNSGSIMIILGTMHYFNLITISVMSKRIINSKNI